MSEKEISLKRSMILRIVLLLSAALIIFITAIAIIVPEFNKRAAKDNAQSYLQIFEKNIQTGTDYEEIVKFTDGELRITIINLTGAVLADTLTEDVSSLDNHKERPEVKEALKGSIGEDIRKSESFGIDYLYFAKKVSSGGSSVILRVAVPVKNINIYVWPLIGIMAAIFAFVLIITILLAPKVINNITAPIAMIKQKLDTIEEPGKHPIMLTRHDEINRVLIEIDEISEKLKFALNDYQSEKNKLDMILENINQGIIAIDNQKRLVSCNKTAEDYFCFEFSEPVSVEKVLINNNLISNINQAIDKNEFISYDHTRVNGQIFEIRFFPVNINDISLIVTTQDVTDLRKISLEKQEFFANAGHELNTPLSSIIGYSEMLITDKKPNAAFCKIINKEALRMKLLIEDMLKISELEENREIRDAKFDLKSVIEQVILAALPKADNKKIALTANLENCKIFANAEKITEVISNLVDNAIKYTNADGTVAVSLKAENGKAILSVKDNGIGIPQNALSRVFERFYRVDKSRSNAEGGTGLGLAIVKHICNHYNAPLKLQSTEGVGTEITVAFTCT